MSRSKISTVYTRANLGIEAPLVSVETHISSGLPRLSIVGLAETEVMESRERVRSSIINSGYEFPVARITINLAPADLPKGGGRYDLPIAIGILVASEQLQVKDIHEYELAGELSLSGELRGIRGALPLALGSRRAKRKLIISADNALEAALPCDNIVFAAANLTEVCNHLKDKLPLQAFEFITPTPTQQAFQVDFADIQGQFNAKRALEIAAAGRHSILFIGPPGTGKTMLASRLPTILPELSLDEALEVVAIHSLTQAHKINSNWKQRPFRTPHHTASSFALIGGGSIPRPGEISLAHHGVLFLDELPEYDRKVLEVLREPIETGFIAISRVNRKTIFPCKFQLVAAMNPCPCGHHGNPKKYCSCTPTQIQRYKNKISKPLLERIDMHVEVPLLSADLLTTTSIKNPSSDEIRNQVQLALSAQLYRQNKPNGLLSNEEVKAFCDLNSVCKALIQQALEKFNLSARSYYRILKVARTIADLDNSTDIALPHLQEALAFRSKIDTNI